eukprot:1159135-Pelagomonas_calceolata.AAC.1
MTRYTWVRELSVNSDGCRDDNIIDALPDMPDPAMSGPQPFPAASALQNIRCAQQQGSLTSPCLILPLLEPQEGAEHHGRCCSKSSNGVSEKEKETETIGGAAAAEAETGYSFACLQGQLSQSKKVQTASLPRHGSGTLPPLIKEPSFCIASCLHVASRVAVPAAHGTVAAVPVLATRAPAGIATIAEAGAVVETEAGTIGVAPLAVGAEAGVQGTGVGKRVCRSQGVARQGEWAGMHWQPKRMSVNVFFRGNQIGNQRGL